MPVWHAPKDLVTAGYLPSRVDLGHLASNPEALKARCAILQAEVRYWVATAGTRPSADYDGSLRSLITIYETHPDSTFQKLRPGPRRSYGSTLQRLRNLIGERHVASVTGLDLIAWRREWSDNGRKPAMASQMRTVLLSAVSLGVAMRLDGCAALATTLREARASFPSNPPRTTVIGYREVVALVEAARSRGAFGQATAYALCYETTLRLADVIGIWWPADRGRISDIVHPATGAHWFGLRWDDIADDGVLRYQPSKTAESSGKTVIFPLKMAPLALKEPKRTPLMRRSGPIILNERTGVPYGDRAFNDGWHKDRDAVRLPETAWARDLRASGITEARAAGATRDDAAMVAGHAGTKMVSSVYDRAGLEAAERFAAARLAYRDRERP